MKWEDTEGEFGPQTKLYWQFLDDDGKLTDSEVVCWVNQNFSPRSKLRMIASVLLGQPDFEEGYKLQMDTLIGKDAILTVSLGPNRDGTGERNKIEAFSPIKRAAVKAAANGGARKPF
jgi:hypothetical protein